MINIIDYGAGNIHSVARAFKHFGLKVDITKNLKKISSKDLLILPGVGAYGHAVEELKKHGLFNPIKEYLQEERPFLGICLGLQLLFESSEENPGIQGLGIFPGKVKKFPASKELSIPQIGWNSLEIQKKEFSEFQNQFFYFVHSYYVDPENKETTLSETNYGFNYVSAVQRKNLIATQFHPEKSGKQGLLFIKKVLNHLGQ